MKSGKTSEYALQLNISHILIMLNNSHNYMCIYLHNYLCIYLHKYLCIYPHNYLCIYPHNYLCILSHITNLDVKR